MNYITYLISRQNTLTIPPIPYMTPSQCLAVRVWEIYVCDHGVKTSDEWLSDAVPIWSLWSNVLWSLVWWPYNVNYTVSLLLFTGHDVFAAGEETGSIKLNIVDLTSDAKTEYQLGVFHLLVCVPLVCAAVQLWFWSHFSLHGKRLSWVKSMRGGLLRYATV